MEDKNKTKKKKGKFYVDTFFFSLVGLKNQGTEGDGDYKLLIQFRKEFHFCLIYQLFMYIQPSLTWRKIPKAL